MNANLLSDAEGYQYIQGKFESLLVSQLEEQRRFFEDKIDKLESRAVHAEMELTETRQQLDGIQEAHGQLSSQRAFVHSPNSRN